MVKGYKAMAFSDLRGWGIALLIVISLMGCGADANTGQQVLSQSLTATDSSEVSPETKSNLNKKNAASIAAMAAVGRELIVPSGNILENLAKVDTLAKFSAILKKSGMVNNLKGTGPYTVLAPSDAALEARYGSSTMKNLLRSQNKKYLQQLVSTHLIAGKLTVADLEDGATLITAGGQQLKVSKRQGKVRINGAIVAIPDTECRNGIVHVLDKVLEPDGLQN